MRAAAINTTGSFLTILFISRSDILSYGSRGVR